MANLPETPVWDAGIYQLETTDVVEGGETGIDNVQAKALANRTQYLKEFCEALGNGKQPLDGTLTALAALALAADKMIYATGPDALQLTTLTAWARDFMEITSASTARTFLGANLEPGAIGLFAMNAAPTGWLKANGAAISRAAYANLFAAIGTTHGVGDGATTFNLPDFRGEFLRGFDDGRGIDVARVFGSFQLPTYLRTRMDDAENSDINSSTNSINVGMAHANPDSAVSSPAGMLSGSGAARAVGTSDNVSIAGQNNSSAVSDRFISTRPRNVAVLACIKY